MSIIHANVICMRAKKRDCDAFFLKKHVRRIGVRSQRSFMKVRDSCWERKGWGLLNWPTNQSTNE